MRLSSFSSRHIMVQLHRTDHITLDRTERFLKIYIKPPKPTDFTMTFHFFSSSSPWNIIFNLFVYTCFSYCYDIWEPQNIPDSHWYEKILKRSFKTFKKLKITSKKGFPQALLRAEQTKWLQPLLERAVKQNAWFPSLCPPKHLNLVIWPKMRMTRAHQLYKGDALSLNFHIFQILCCPRM